jgi:hypothetical protein
MNRPMMVRKKRGYDGGSRAGLYSPSWATGPSRRGLKRIVRSQFALVELSHWHIQDAAVE